MNPPEALATALEQATANLRVPQSIPNEVQERLAYVVECQSNRACVRLLMACLLAKIEKPGVDARKPYTEIGGSDCFLGIAAR